QRFPKGPAVMPVRWVKVGTRYSVTTPEVVTLATWFLKFSVSQRLPSGPAAMLFGSLLAVGIGYSVKAPEIVTLATMFVLFSTNQRFPSGPGAMPQGLLLG